MSNPNDGYEARKPEDRIVVRGICVHEGRIVVIRRQKKGEEYIVLPGGGINRDEPEAKAVEREIAEETGVVVRALRRVLVIPESEEFSRHHIWRCEFVSGEPHLDPNSEEAQRSIPGVNTYEPCWMDVEEVRKVVLPRAAAEKGLL